jgi:excisionase family DNA binding protein
MSDILLTIPKFAERTGLTYWLARALVLRGDIPSVQCGRRRRVSAKFVEAWCAGTRPHVAPGTQRPNDAAPPA